MATLAQQPNGRYVVQVDGKDGKRRSVRLGAVSERQAESLRSKIADLERSALVGDAAQEDTRLWASKLEGKLRDRVAAVGLVPLRPRHKLGAFIDAFTCGQAVKDATRAVYGRARRHLVDFFGADKLIASITASDAQDWKRQLLKDDLADATVRRMSGMARQFFHHAVRSGWLESNPFTGLPCTVRSNRDRVFYVTGEIAVRVLKACPDAEWRLIFALARFAGLRCPSELAGLRWADVDWTNRRITVRSPKTEHHEGGDGRTVPMFPQLLPYLRECVELADDGAVLVVPRASRIGVNINPQMRRIVDRAKVTPWPKMFVNLRSSCESDLLKLHPFHAVCAWMGHGPEISMRHYAQVTEDDFKKAVQNPVQHMQAGDGTGGQGKTAESSQAVETTTASTKVPAGADACYSAGNEVSGQGRT